MFCSRCQNHYFWWLWSECSPLPIPNREVKPHIADDTALVCGKVGRRQFFIRESQSRFPLFVCPPRSVSSTAGFPPSRCNHRTSRFPPSLVKTSRFGYLLFSFRLSFSFFSAIFEILIIKNETLFRGSRFILGYGCYGRPDGREGGLAGISLRRRRRCCCRRSRCHRCHQCRCCRPWCCRCR